ncbi:MAG: amidohydrolase family protein, partial [Chloroflexota bacterium]
LTLSAACYPEIGPLMKIFPLIRQQSDQMALWQAVTDGTVSTLGSDHAPHTVREQQRPLEAKPAGFAGVETFGPLMIDHMLRGTFRPEKLAHLLSEGTARLYRLYPRKGAIRAGSDADLTFVDPSVETEIRNERLHSKQPISPYHGRHLRGSITRTVLRGRTVMLEGEPVGEPTGRLVTPLSRDP